MIRIEHVIEPSGKQMAFVIEGMRNPMNSWDKSDSLFDLEMGMDVGGNMHLGGTGINNRGYWAPADADINNGYFIGPNDKELMIKLKNAGKDHRKFMRQMPIMMRITAPMYWWKEFDTYKVGTVRNSCSTMHKITAKEFDISDFSTEHLTSDSIKLTEDTINVLNHYRAYYLHWDELSDSVKENNEWKEKKDIWWQLIQLLPSSYNQTANVTLNYEVLANIYNARKNHKLDEWREFCKLAESFEYAFLYSDEVSDAENFDARR